MVCMIEQDGASPKGLLAKIATDARTPDKASPTPNTAQDQGRRAFTLSRGTVQPSGTAPSDAPAPTRVRPLQIQPKTPQGSADGVGEPVRAKASGTPSLSHRQLDKHNANKVGKAPTERGQSRRLQDFALRQSMQRHSRDERFQACGHRVIAPSGLVGVVMQGDRAKFSGLSTCMSVWHCPVCARKVQKKRQREVQDVVEKELATGNGALFGTLTLPHYKHDALRDTVSLVVSGVKKIRQDKLLRGFRIIRALEVTVSERNGFHPHVHYVLFLNAPVDEQTLANVRRRVLRVWSRHVFNATGRQVLSQHCPVEEVETGNVGAYAAKLSIGYELASSSTKEGRGASQTPFQLMVDFLETGDTDALNKWWEYERVMKGRRQLTWSRGLRLSEDEDILTDGDEDATPERVVATVPLWLWRKVKARRGEDARLLTLLERHGLQAFNARLQSIAEYQPPNSHPLMHGHLYSPPPT